MFYFESDRQEIWVRIDETRAEFQRYLSGCVTHQDLQDFAQYHEEFKSQIERKLKSCAATSEVKNLQQTINELTKYIGQFSEDITALQNENARLRQEIYKPSARITALEKAVDDLQNRIFASQPAPDQSARIAALEKAVDDLQNRIFASQPAPDQSARIAALEKAIGDLQNRIFASQPAPDQSARIATLEKIIADQGKIIFNLQQEISALKPAPKPVEVKPAPAKPVEPAVKPAPPPEAIFFLPEQAGVFLPNDRAKIPVLVKAALNLKAVEKFLAQNPSETSGNFQKLVASHLREVKKFIDKLKLSDLDNDELSETVTAKYFKLFKRIIFDNLLVAVKRGLKDDAPFYTELLRLLNEYLTRCGIFTVNATSGRKADNDDYENMAAQILENADKNLAENISDIERLPYRINYLDEFGELKFLQHNGVMSVYKAV